MCAVSLCQTRSFYPTSAHPVSALILEIYNPPVPLAAILCVSSTLWRIWPAPLHLVPMPPRHEAVGRLDSPSVSVTLSLATFYSRRGPQQRLHSVQLKGSFPLILRCSTSSASGCRSAVSQTLVREDGARDDSECGTIFNGHLILFEGLNRPQTFVDGREGL